MHAVDLCRTWSVAPVRSVEGPFMGCGCAIIGVMGACRMIQSRTSSFIAAYLRSSTLCAGARFSFSNMEPAKMIPH